MGPTPGYYKPMGEMYSDHTRIPSLQAILEGAMHFGLTEDEAWRATDEALHDVGRDATISEYLEELTGALARHILYKQQHTPSQERRSGHEERHVPSEELY
jgi:hypothetical protein